MKFPELVSGEFIRRDNRFRAAVLVEGKEAAAHETADPLFAQTLRTAVASGVEAQAYNCRLTLETITIAGEIPVQLVW